MFYLSRLIDKCRYWWHNCYMGAVSIFRTFTFGFLHLDLRKTRFCVRSSAENLIFWRNWANDPKIRNFGGDEPPVGDRDI